MNPAKPHFVLVGHQPVEVPQETPLERARKRPWTKGPSYWTPERIAVLAAQNEVTRQLRGKT